MIEAFLETVTETLARDDNVQIVGFGSFKTSERKARSGVIPVPVEQYQSRQKEFLPLLPVTH